MTICREIGFVTRRSSAAGGRTKNQPTAHMLNSKWLHRRNWQRFSLPVASRSPDSAFSCGSLACSTRAIGAWDRHLDQAFLAPDEDSRAHAAGSLECASMSKTCLAWNRSERLPVLEI